MAIFEIEYNGAKFNIEAPDDASEEDVINAALPELEEYSRIEENLTTKEKIARSLNKFASSVDETISPILQQTLNLPKGILRGIVNTGQAATDAINLLSGLPIVGEDIGAFASKVRTDLQATKEAFLDPIRPREEDTVGRVIEGVGQIIGPYAGANKILSSAKVADGFLKAMTAGAVADFSAFDDAQENLSNILVQADNPILNNLVTQYLSIDEDDPVLERRIKRVLEGGIIGATILKTAGGLKAAKDKFMQLLKITKAKKLIEQPIEEAVKPTKVVVSTNIKAAKEAARAAEKPSSKIIIETDLNKAIKEAQRRLAPDIKLSKDDAVPQLFKREIHEKVTKQVTDAVDAAALGKPDEAKRIFERVTDLIREDELNWSDLPKILEKYNMTKDQFADELMATWSAAGKKLAALSKIRRQWRRLELSRETLSREKDIEGLAKLLGINKKNFIRNLKQADDELRYLFTDRSGMDLIARWWNRLENFRRSNLVTQLVTAVRNVRVQLAAGLIGDFENLTSGLLRGIINKGRVIITGRDKVKYLGPLEEIAVISWNTPAFFKAFTKRHRNLINNIIENYRNPEETARLISTPVHEVAAFNKISKVLNTFNRAQEVFMRKALFEARLATNLARRGKSIWNIDPKEIPSSDVADAVEYSLRMTFAASPKSNFSKSLVRFWSKTPLTLINPFPRFNFANAIPFFWDRMFGMFSARFVRALRSGNADVIADVMSKQITGATMLGIAWQIRDAYGVKGRPYELRIKDPDERGEIEVIDTRGDAPLSTWLFAADALRDIIRGEQTIPFQDYMKQLVGVNRLAGTGFNFFDWFRTDSIDAVKKSLGQLGGQYLASFSVPLRQLKDAYTLFDPEEAVLRDVKTRPVLGPLLNNIPELSQTLPPRFNPFSAPIKEGDIKVEELFYPDQQLKLNEATLKWFDKLPVPSSRQIFGLTKKTMNIVEQEFHRLGINSKLAYPSTGVAEADRLIRGYTGYLHEKITVNLLNSEFYNSMSDIEKKIFLEKMISDIKKSAKMILLARHTGLAMLVRLEGEDEDMLELFNELGIGVGENIGEIILRNDPSLADELEDILGSEETQAILKRIRGG